MKPKHVVGRKKSKDTIYAVFCVIGKIDKIKRHDLVVWLRYLADSIEGKKINYDKNIVSETYLSTTPYEVPITNPLK